MSVVSLGSNLGNRLGHLRAGLAVLEPAEVSSVWETDPVGGIRQGEFLNLIALVPLDAAATWQRAQQAECVAGRVRTVRWGPRTLDVDLVVGEGAGAPGLTVPHPRAHERAFVLAPWLELQPDAVLPGHGPVAVLLARLGLAGVRRTDLVL